MCADTTVCELIINNNGTLKYMHVKTISPTIFNIAPVVSFIHYVTTCLVAGRDLCLANNNHQPRHKFKATIDSLHNNKGGRVWFNHSCMVWIMRAPNALSMSDTFDQINEGCLHHSLKCINAQFPALNTHYNHEALATAGTHLLAYRIKFPYRSQLSWFLFPFSNYYFSDSNWNRLHHSLPI